MFRIKTAPLFLLLLALAACTPVEELVPLPPIPDPPKIEAEEALVQADYFVKIDGWRRNNGNLENFQLSGFLIRHNEQLYVITAGHVQKKDTKVTDLQIYFNQDRSVSYGAEIAAINNDIDVAVISITSTLFQFSGRLAILGNSELVSKGDPVVSLGHPPRLQWHASSGKVISLSYRNSNVSLAQIQHSAFGGFGSSGGPLLNGKGEVIGMNISMRTRTTDETTSDRINALPSNRIREYLDYAFTKK